MFSLTSEIAFLDSQPHVFTPSFDIFPNIEHLYSL